MSKPQPKAINRQRFLAIRWLTGRHTTAARRVLGRKPVALLAVLLVAAGGSLLLGLSRASTSVTAVEPERGALSGAVRFNDVSASGSAGVRFEHTVSGNGRMVNVSTAPELTAALADARPGDAIHLADGVYADETAHLGNYYADFGIAVSGTASAPITLTGSRNAVLDAGSPGSHYGLYIYQASYWNITGITITDASKGLVMDGGNHITLDSIRVYNIGSEAVHFRAFSSDNVLKNSVIEQTGVRQAQYGEGVYIGSANSNWATYSGGQPDASDRNQVLNNTIGNTGAENIDIKEGGSNGIIDGNHFDGVHMQGENSADSWIDVKGNNYTVTNNTSLISSSDNTVFSNGFELHQAVVGWGINNVFHHNTLNLANATVSGTTSGFGFYQQKNLTGNILSCDNSVLNAPQGFGVYNVSPQACNDQ